MTEKMKVMNKLILACAETCARNSRRYFKGDEL